MIKNKTYFVNEIIINEQIWKPKAINRPVEANSTILDLSKEQLTPLPQIVLKTHEHCQPLLLTLSWYCSFFTPKKTRKRVRILTEPPPFCNMCN